MAFAKEAAFSVEAVAVELLNDALAQPNSFILPDLDEKNIYLCNPIHPYALIENELQSCEDIEYYLIKTETEFIGCITLCYVDSVLMSASLNLDIATQLNETCETDDAFQLVANNGLLYIRTAASPIATNGVDTDSTVFAIASASGHLEVATVRSQLTGIVTCPVVPRSSKLLSVPFVPQQGGTCWAAAGAAFGQYYTGSTYAHYTASDLASLMGIGIDDGGYIEDTTEMLRRYFLINTIIVKDRLSDNDAITLFQQSKPIIANFHGDVLGTDINIAHMVVLCGYDDGGNGATIKYYIRDSNYESVVSVFAYSSDILVMEYYSGQVMFWDESAYYVYNP